MSSRVTAVVERALDDRQREAAEEVERILAVMERGVAIVICCLRHQMDADPHLLSMSRAATGQISAGAHIYEQIAEPMRELLSEPVAALGSKDVRRDADAMFYCTATTMHSYLDWHLRPDPDDVNHLVRFCLRALGAS